ncbi:hypothetical protein [Castellaniella caeni]|uniref:hypothetical protein n=1 Tax=Castellaniella caeni TaxID=266123 RepID=UPI0015E130E4|nr:hypothetical protein [Castellaniella caeni]
MLIEHACRGEDIHFVHGRPVGKIQALVILLVGICNEGRSLPGGIQRVFGFLGERNDQIRAHGFRAFFQPRKLCGGIACGGKPYADDCGNTDEHDQQVWKKVGKESFAACSCVVQMRDGGPGLMCSNHVFSTGK